MELELDPWRDDDGDAVARAAAAADAKAAVCLASSTSSSSSSSMSFFDTKESNEETLQLPKVLLVPTISNELAPAETDATPVAATMSRAHPAALLVSTISPELTDDRVLSTDLETPYADASPDAPETNFTQETDQQDDFGGFEGPASVAANDDFGGFEGPALVAASDDMTPTIANATAVTAPETGGGGFDDDDDFGDFGTSEQAPTSVPVAEPMVKVVDDYFGDFGTSEQAPKSEPVPPVVKVVSDPDHEARVDRILGQSISTLQPKFQDIAMRFAVALKETFPLEPLPAVATDGANEEIYPLADDYDPVTPPADAPAADPSSVQSSKIRMPNPRFENEEWYLLWKRLMKDLEYSENINTRFRWKKSQIRVDFLKALDIHVAPEDEAHHSTAPAAAPANSQPATIGSQSASSSQSASTDTQSGAAQPAPLSSSVKPIPVSKLPQRIDSVDSRMEDLLEAKRLCGISEDDLRKKSIEELEALVKMLAHSQLKIQEQGNYWLDAREQLAMDAEQHQRMIASLVQYAKQQVVGGKGKHMPKGKKKTPAKH